MWKSDFSTSSLAWGQLHSKGHVKVVAGLGLEGVGACKDNRESGTYHPVSLLPAL